MEKFIESIFYASRWLLAPIYTGLSLALILLAIKFFQELIHVFPIILGKTEAELVLVVLSLIDLALVGGLLVMVMFSGYENFISQIDLKEGTDKLSWLGKLDAGSLKQKVAASIVAISSIHLLKVFMNFQGLDFETNGEESSIGEIKLKWYVIMHLTFVLSAIGMAFIDKMNSKKA